MSARYDPLVSSRPEALTADERMILDELDFQLDLARLEHRHWRVQAALIAGAALMLDALGSET